MCQGVGRSWQRLFRAEEYGFVFLDRVDTEGGEDVGGKDSDMKAGLLEAL